MPKAGLPRRAPALRFGGHLLRRAAQTSGRLCFLPHSVRVRNGGGSNRGGDKMGKGAIACILAACCLAALFMSAPASAQVEKELDFCTGKNNPTPDQTMEGCLAVLKSGRWTKKTSAFAYDNIGRALMAKGDIDMAIKSYDEALSNDPDFALSYHNRGLAYGAKDDFDHAIADFTAAIKANAAMPPAFSDRGWAYRQKGDLDQARFQLRPCL
jgi:tetratricopeptide (TPR) repeat protein